MSQWFAEQEAEVVKVMEVSVVVVLVSVVMIVILPALLFCVAGWSVTDGRDQAQWQEALLLRAR